LIVPKKAIQTLPDLGPNDSAFLAEVFFTVLSLVNKFHLPAYRLVVNGGEYQDFPQLHFHLISDIKSEDTTE
jgi:diadenosine tetraphosphate (Ap4A) HIT family hydrolase